MLGMETRQGNHGWEVKLTFSTSGFSNLRDLYRWCDGYDSVFACAVVFGRATQNHNAIMEGLRAAKIYPD